MLKLTTKAKPGEFPSIIDDLAGNCAVGYRKAGHETNYHLNLFPLTDQGAPATGIFIGSKTPEDAADVFNKMSELFKYEEDGKRVVVWYRNPAGVLKKKYAKSKPKYTDNTKKSGRSIKIGRRR
ncbi:MAG: hypothetical protein JWQ09_5115 [Segetibacter sp.]|nr:hypothetical protein [Segetibacter sp.]